MRIPMSELQAAFAGRLRKRFDTAMEEITGTVEDHGVDARRLGALGDGLADRRGAVGRARVAVAERGTQCRLSRRRGRERPATGVVDELRADMAEAAEHRQARTRRGSGDVLAHAAVATRSSGAPVVLREHSLQPLTT